MQISVLTLHLSLLRRSVKASKTFRYSNLMTAANFNSGACRAIRRQRIERPPTWWGYTGNDGDRKSPDFRIHDQRNVLITVAPDTDIELCGLGVSEVSVVGQAGSAKILASQKTCTRFISEQSLATARSCRSNKLAICNTKTTSHIPNLPGRPVTRVFLTSTNCGGVTKIVAAQLKPRHLTLPTVVSSRLM